MWLWGLVFVVSLSGYYYMRYIILSIENEIKDVRIIESFIFSITHKIILANSFT